MILYEFINKHWDYLFMFYGIFVLIATILANFMYESPRYLYEKEQFEEARKVISKMAEMNKGSTLISGAWLFDKEAENIQKSFKKVSINDEEATVEEHHWKGSLTHMNVKDKENPWKIMRTEPIVIVNLVILCICWISASFNTYLLSFDLRNLGGDIFINSWAIGFAGFAGKLAAIVLRKFISTKISLIICLTFGILAGSTLIFIKSTVLIALCVGIAEGSIGCCFALLYFATTEYFPPLFTAFAFAVCQLGARSFTILSYLLSDLADPIPMILLSSKILISCLLLIFLSKPSLSDGEETDED